MSMTNVGPTGLTGGAVHTRPSVCAKVGNIDEGVRVSVGSESRRDPYSFVVERFCSFLL